MDNQPESYVNVKGLRALYGRSGIGQKNRKDIKITVTPETMAMLSRHVRFGRGSYGSPFIELSIRLLLAMIDNGEDIPEICNEIKSVSRSPYLQNNVRIFKDIMER